MKPIVQALLVADHVYTDVTTGKKVIAGIFHHLKLVNIVGKAPSEQESTQGKESLGEVEVAKISVPPGGMVSGSPFCYVSLTEVRGSATFQLRYVDIEEDSVVFTTSFVLECDNPLKTIELVFPLPLLPHNKSGTFALELLWNNEPLGYHRITVESYKEPTNDS